MKITQMMEVFQAGKEVANPEFWKQKTIKANAIMVLISGIVAILNMFDCSLCDLQLTSEQIIGITTGITTIAGIFNAGSTMATSAKVGFKPTKTSPEEVVEEEIEEVVEEEIKEKVKPSKKKMVESSLSDDIEKLQ
jgi:hypothetical protein